MNRPLRRGLCIPLSLLLVSAAIAGPANSSNGGDLTQLSLEELMNVEVTSVSKKAQPLSKAPAAAYVLTSDDIRRSGMTNIPDLLRLVPGVNVARITTNSWAISIRGFNDKYSNKVLVLVDGRSVYTAEFSGVIWDHLSVPLEDIERIEVIRGPGGTVWGANAVNGVINIITKHSQDTQGGLVSIGSGSVDSAQTHMRYGGVIGNLGTYRVYGRYYNVEDSINWDGSRAADGWTGRQAGMRADFHLSARDTLLFKADFHATDSGQTVSAVQTNEGPQIRTFNDTIESLTRNFLGRWDHAHKSGAVTSVQMYYSHAYRADVGYDDYDTADAELQHRFSWGNRHDIVAGAGFRFNRVQWKLRYNSRYDEDHLNGHLANAFLQDEIALTRNVSLTLGSKFEHNNFTGFEIEPSAQLMWSPSDEKAVWVSVARAIRQPSFLNNHAMVDLGSFPLGDGITGSYRMIGTHNVQPERVLDFEAGYRTAITSRVTLDLTAFRSQYRGLITVETRVPSFTLQPRPTVVFESNWSNLAGANNYGAEATANWQATDALRLTGSYSYLQMNVWPYANSTDFTVSLQNGTSPKHQWQVRSHWKLRPNLEWDASLFRVGDVKTNSFGFEAVLPGWVRVDTRLGWRFHENGEFSITGQNLLTPHRVEFRFGYHSLPTQVQRAVFGKLTWTF